MKDNNNNTVEVKEEVMEEKEYWQITKPKFLSKKSKEAKEATEENGEPKVKKGSKVVKFLKGAALVGVGALAGAVGKSLADKAGSDDSDDYVEVVDSNESENE